MKFNREFTLTFYEKDHVRNHRSDDESWKTKAMSIANDVIDCMTRNFTFNYNFADFLLSVDFICTVGFTAFFISSYVSLNTLTNLIKFWIRTYIDLIHHTSTRDLLKSGIKFKKFNNFHKYLYSINIIFIYNIEIYWNLIRLLWNINLFSRRTFREKSHECWWANFSFSYNLPKVFLVKHIRKLCLSLIPVKS